MASSSNHDAGPRAFLLDQFHGMVLQATVQRARIYRDGSGEPARDAFRRGLRRLLDSTASRYSEPLSESAHEQHIARIADALSAAHGDALRADRFRIGPAQKALNLHLKYLWCAGWIPEPPHCPLDRVIIELLPYRVRTNWTDLDDLDSYRRLIAAAREVAQPDSLARWELRAYAGSAAAALRGSHS